MGMIYTCIFVHMDVFSFFHSACFFLFIHMSFFPIRTGDFFTRDNPVRKMPPDNPDGIPGTGSLKRRTRPACLGLFNI